MVFKVPARKTSKATTFEFTLPGEKSPRSIPLLQYLDADLAQDLFRGSVRAQAAVSAGQDDDPEVAIALMDALTAAIERYHPGITKRIDQEQLAALLTAWQSAGTVTAGE